MIDEETSKTNPSKEFHFRSSIGFVEIELIVLIVLGSTVIGVLSSCDSIRKDTDKALVKGESSVGHVVSSVKDAPVTEHLIKELDLRFPSSEKRTIVAQYKKANSEGTVGNVEVTYRLAKDGSESIEISPFDIVLDTKRSGIGELPENSEIARRDFGFNLNFTSDDGKTSVKRGDIEIDYMKTDKGPEYVYAIVARATGFKLNSIPVIGEDIALILSSLGIDYKPEVANGMYYIYDKSTTFSFRIENSICTRFVMSPDL